MDPNRQGATGPGREVRFPEELPISACIREIAQAVADHPVVVVAGETGSGKTTQLPKLCLAMGRGLSARIGVTQPRRIAATSVSARVASELGVELGREVGYQIRFANRTGPGTYVKFMTDGILLAEMQGDPLLSGYDTLILDEAHERTLNIDFLLGFVKRLLPRRPDLRVIVSSATLETDRFAAFFDGAPVIQVSGRTFPVETVHRARGERDEADLAQAIAETVEEITSIDPREDILVFLPGEREIREAMDALTAHALPHTVLLPLYGRLTQAEQARVFQSLPQRRIVLATNVAETSLTIPGIVYVIDSGLARVNRYVARSGVTRLLVEPISRASADQRKGRAGRTRSGVCFRLYDEKDFALRSAYTDPEVLRVGLAGVILQMKSLGLGDVRAFPFLDPPPKRAVDEGFRVLEELGALDAAGELTDIGRKIAKLPLDPRVARMILAGQDHGALREVLVIAAALGIQDPRERPLAAQKQADQKHRRFADETSDFLGLLKLWAFGEEIFQKGQSHCRKACRDHFLSWVRMREWRDVHRQLTEIARELALEPNARPAAGDAVHRAILPGLLSRVGMWHPDTRQFMGARHTRFQIHPSSALARKPVPWVVVAELVETSQLFGRTAARIDPAWLEAAAGSLCKQSHGDPHWSEKPAQVMARENVTLFGLPIAKERKVHYGPIDPVLSRRLFIVHALVRGEYAPSSKRSPYLEHNRALFEQVRALRDRARKSDMMADDEGVAQFFEQRIPAEVHSGKTFEQWRAQAEAKDPRVLFLGLADVLLEEASDLAPERFPDKLTVAGASLGITYRFEPGEDDDGATVVVPVVLLPQVDPGLLEWTIPGWQADKVTLLLHSLPKALRKALGSVADVARAVFPRLRPFEEPLLAALAGAVFEETGVRIPPDAFDLDDLPRHLRFFFRVVEGTRVLGEGRDLAALRLRFGARAREVWAAVPREPSLEREGLTSFAIDSLPEVVETEAGGTRLIAYPALVDAETSVAVRLVTTRAAADDSTRAGLRRLVLLQPGTSLQKLEQQIPQRIAMSSIGDAPRRKLALRALDDAYRLGDAATFPRTPAAFAARCEEGRRRLPGAIAELGALAQAIAVELDKVRAMLRAMTGKPGSPRVALDDVHVQLEHLVPPDLLVTATATRLAHVPRYLRAVQVRLERLPNGPQKDLSKSDQVRPFWSDWLTQHRALLARGVPAEELDEFRWLVEELRVSVFAPELRTAVSVSAKRLEEMWKAITGGR